MRNCSSEVRADWRVSAFEPTTRSGALDQGESLLIPNRHLEEEFESRLLTPADVLDRPWLCEWLARRTTSGSSPCALIAERLDARPLVAAAEVAMNRLEPAAV